jgi:hypothetical protein
VSAHSELNMGSLLRVLGNGQINLAFRRNFEAPEWMEWVELESELAEIEVTSEEDSVKWALTSHGQSQCTPYIYIRLS